MPTYNAQDDLRVKLSDECPSGGVSISAPDGIINIRRGEYTSVPASLKPMLEGAKWAEWIEYAAEPAGIPSETDGTEKWNGGDNAATN